MTTRTNLTKTTLATGGTVALLAAAVLGGGSVLAQGGGHDAAQGQPVQQAAAAQASPQLPTIQETWTGSWQQEDVMTVTHPTLGQLEIRTYFQDLHPGSAPSAGRVAYAVYQDGRPVGFAQGSGTQATPLLHGQTFPVPVVHEDDGRVSDAHGNVFLISGSDVVMLHPTDTGYDSQGTLPGGGNDALRNATELTIDWRGDASIVTQHGKYRTVPTEVNPTGLVADD